MVKVNYASLQTQSSTMSSASQSRVAGFNQLISAFDSFGGSGGELIGTGYDAARAYATSVMSPYYKGCILYSEAVADAANTLADSYAAKCGAENLDEEQLQAEIDSATRGCMGLSASISGLQSKAKPAAGDAERIGRLQEQLTAAENQLTAAQKKLDNLRAFSAESPSACASADGYQGLVSKAMSGISVSFGGGGFALPEDLTWVSDVEQGWAEREIAMENNYLSALEKVKNGESLTEAELTAIERYAATYPERVDASVLEYVQQARQIKAEEMKIRGLIDKVDAGKSLTDEETKTLQDYQSNHPDSNLLGNVKYALAQNEAKKNIEKQKEVDNSSVQQTNEYIELANDRFEDGTNILEVIEKTGKWLISKSANTLSELTRASTVASQGGPNGFVMLGENLSRVARNNAQSATKMAKVGGAMAKVGKILDNPITKVLGFGLGVWNDVANEGKTLGQAVVHTGTSTAIGSLASLGTAGLIGMLAGGPVGWAGLAGFAVGYGAVKLFDGLYESNFLGMRDGLDNVGKELDKGMKVAGDWIGDTVSGIGQAFSGGLASLNPFS